MGLDDYETPVLFDTNILIDSLRGIVQAHQVLEDASDYAISQITWVEVMAGTTPSTEAPCRLFLSEFLLLPISSEVCERAARIRRDHKRLKLPDAMILATAQVSGRVLVTRNTRDFPAGTAGMRVPYQL